MTTPPEQCCLAEFNGRPPDATLRRLLGHEAFSEHRNPKSRLRDVLPRGLFLGGVKTADATPNFFASSVAMHVAKTKKEEALFAKEARILLCDKVLLVNTTAKGRGVSVPAAVFLQLIRLYSKWRLDFIQSLEDKSRQDPLDENIVKWKQLFSK